MAEFELKIRSRDIDTLIREIKKNDADADVDIVLKAYKIASKFHEGQVRLSGEPYIIHPLEVALILTELKMDVVTISAGLLHDVVEDTDFTLKDLTEIFDEDLAALVDGVTKISSLKNRSKAVAQAETLRKMLIATIKDVRVIIIKLADKLHNMRTLMFQKPEKQERIARETLDIYAPIAKRLGMTKISSELEDLSFHVLYRDEYNKIKEKLSLKKNELEEYIESIQKTLYKEFDFLKIETEIKGRTKHYFSIFRKMKLQNKSFEDIYDIRAVRIITKEVRDCYAILGVIHTLWTPIATRFKDYIAVPKSNMYQSLHTTVIGPSGVPLEVQIRTKEMDQTAEMGIAAHWLYKEQPSEDKKEIYKDLQLLKNLKKLYLKSDNSREFMTSLKMDLYEDEIFVFTPKGKIVKLANGATPVDFAFAIHSDVGLHTSGARVNNKMVALKTKLKSGDIIEVFTTNKAHPSESWLKFVKSSKARYKIRSWLRKSREEIEKQNLETKKGKIISKEEKVASVSIPEREQLKLKKLSSGSKDGITVDGNSNVLIRLSQCCQPIPGDDVVGFITRGRGITIHKKNCPSLKRLEKERFINVIWEDDEQRFYPVKISVEGLDKPNLLKDILDELALCKTNIIKVEASVVDAEKAKFKFILEVNNSEHLDFIMNKIRQIKNISDVFKLNEKVILK